MSEPSHLLLLCVHASFTSRWPRVYVSFATRYLLTLTHVYSSVITLLVPV